MNRRPDMLTRAEAAAYLGCSREYLARNTPHRGGPACLKVGRTPYYLKSDLDSWLAAQRQPSTIAPKAPCPELRPASASPASPSTSERAPRTGGSTSATAASDSAVPLAQSIAERLRRQHGRTGTTSSPRLVGLRGGKGTTSPSSPVST